MDWIRPQPLPTRAGYGFVGIERRADMEFHFDGTGLVTFSRSSSVAVLGMGVRFGLVAPGPVPRKEPRALRHRRRYLGDMEEVMRGAIVRFRFNGLIRTGETRPDVQSADSAVFKMVDDTMRPWRRSVGGDLR